MLACRLLVDPPGDGAWNMALDEALLESRLPCLRLYAWTPATLSLGYFQRLADRDLHPASRRSPVVRRSSGGGAIVHDRELTYSLVLPHDARAASRQSDRDVYLACHEAAIDALAARGIAARLCGAAADPPGRAAPFLCFARRAAEDLLVGDAKILGSAQRRVRGALLQHGSFLVARSPAAPELPGILDLLPTARRELDPVSIEEWQTRFADDFVVAVAHRLELGLGPDAPTPSELARARAIVAEKYAADAWTART